VRVSDSSREAARDPAERRRALLRKVAPLVLVAFVGVGVWLYRARMPVDVELRLVVPPTLRGQAASFPRELMLGLAGEITTDEGERVATFEVPLRDGLVSPLAPPVAVQLRRGPYLVTARARGPAGAEATLAGAARVEGAGELRVELARPRR